MAKRITMKHYNGTGYDDLHPDIEALNIPPDYIVSGANVTVSRNTGTGQVTIAASAGILESAAITATSWLTSAAANRMYGYYYKAVAVPAGKRILAVLDANGTPAGMCVGSNIYSNVAFAGTVVFG